MKKNKIISLLLCTLIATQGQAQMTFPDSLEEDSTVKAEMTTYSPEYGVWFANLEKNINIFIADYQKAFPINSIDNERLAQKIEDDLSSANETDTSTLLAEIEATQNRHLPKEGDEATEAELKLLPYRDMAYKIVYSALKFNKPEQVDLLISYLLMRFLKSPHDRQAIWLILETFRDERLGENQRLLIERNKSYWYNFTAAGGATLIADLVIMAMLPRIKGTDTYAKLVQLLQRRLPSIFGKAKVEMPKLLALPKPQDVSAPYTKTIKVETPNLPSKYVIINGRLTETKRTGPPHKLEIFRTPKGEPVKPINVTLEAKSKWAERLLSVKPSIRAKQLAWFGGSFVVGGATGGLIRQKMHENDWLWMNDYEVLPQEEYDRYLSQAAALKLQCAAQDLNARVSNRNYHLLPEKTYLSDATELNELFNSYALLVVLSPTLLQKKPLALKQTFDNGTVEFHYDNSLGIWTFQRQFEESFEVESWDCPSMKNIDSAKTEVSLSEALQNLSQIKDSILLGRLRQRLEKSQNTIAFDNIDPNLKLESVDWLKAKKLLESQPPLAVQQSKKHAERMLNLSDKNFDIYLMELVCEYKQGTYKNIPLLLAISVALDNSDRVGSIKDPADLLLTKGLSCE